MNPRLPVLGGIVALALAWPTSSALTDLAHARAARDRNAMILARPAPPPATAPDAAFPADGVVDARRRLAARLRAQADSGGVLVESLSPDTTAPSRLAVVAVRVSGPEKSIFAFADTLERGAPATRWIAWRLTPAAGGIRLEGQVVAPWRG